MDQDSPVSSKVEENVAFFCLEETVSSAEIRNSKMRLKCFLCLFIWVSYSFFYGNNFRIPHPNPNPNPNLNPNPNPKIGRVHGLFLSYALLWYKVVKLY